MVAASRGEVIALDANFLVAARSAGTQEAKRLEQWLQDRVPIQVSAIAWSEYLCGPTQGDETGIIRKFITTVEAFGEQEAALAGQLFIDTGRRSRSHSDCMIAAHAISRGASLATLNVRDFRPFEKYGLTRV